MKYRLCYAYYMLGFKEKKLNHSVNFFEKMPGPQESEVVKKFLLRRCFLLFDEKYKCYRHLIKGCAPLIN